MTSQPAVRGVDDRQAIRQLVVQQARWEAEGVMSLRLVDPSGADLPSWEPGAHIDLVLPSGTVRQYSLCGDPEDRSAYLVAVLRDGQGRGGSREVHDTPLVGRTLGIRGPRNHFKLRDADDYLFIAGGIGVTPIMTMAREASRRARPFRVVYGGRSRRTMSFLAELAELELLDVVPEDERGLPDLDGLLDHASSSTGVYCCGPEGLIRAVEAKCAERELDLHIERFTSGDVAVPPSGADAAGQGSCFQIELARAGLTLDVPADRTILEVVREHLPDVMSTCEEGFCGACETSVIEGTPEHRDTVLDATERQANETMMICVSRSCSPKLVLDI